VRIYVHTFNRIGSSVRKSMDRREHCLTTVQKTGKEGRLPKINSRSLKKWSLQLLEGFGVPTGRTNRLFLIHQ
jgi:hypothetical protein